jgi:dTMP kinase
VARGRFIVFEGGEACGKSTQARLLAEALGAVLTHEPGATAVGANVRQIVLDPATRGLDDHAEALLIAADKAQHVTEIVVPALEAGTDVVCDRYVASALAYQGYGRGLDIDPLHDVLRFATRGLEPDLTILLEVPAAEAERRLGSRLDRLEGLGDAFHERVRAGFAALAAADPERWVVLDAMTPIDTLAAEIRELVRTRKGRRAD